MPYSVYWRSGTHPLGEFSCISFCFSFIMSFYHWVFYSVLSLKGWQRLDILFIQVTVNCPALCLNAMLHQAIFLATCNATMTNEKPFNLQWGCHAFEPFFATCNAYNKKQDGGRAKSPTSWALIGSFWQNCVASCRGEVTRKQLVSQCCEK